MKLKSSSYLPCFFTVFHLVCILFTKSKSDNDHNIIYLLFILNGIISCLFLFQSPKPFSFQKLFWIFSWVYLSFSPSLQFAAHKFPWLRQDISANNCLTANLLITLCLSIFGIISLLFSLYWNQYFKTNEVKFELRFSIKNNKTIILSLIIVASFLIYYLVGFAGLLNRSMASWSQSYHNNITVLVVDKIARGTFLFVLLFGVQLFVQKKMSFHYFLGLLLIIFVFNFPLAIPRYFVAALYFSAILTFKKIEVWGKNSITYVLLIILLIGSPLSNATRYIKSKNLEAIKQPFSEFQVANILADFDAYASLCRTIKVVEQSGNTSGHQLLGAIGFFIPRSIWKTKPNGSGFYVYELLNYRFRNVSCPYIAEGYLNFGWMGSVIFTIIIAFFACMYDNYFYPNQSNHSNFKTLYYPVFWCLFLFILRGDMMSSFAYTIGVGVIGYIWKKIFYKSVLDSTHNSQLKGE